MADRAFDTMSCVSTHVPVMSDSDTPRTEAITSRLSHKRKNRGPGWQEKNRKRVRAWYEFNGWAWKNKEQGEQDQSEVALPGLKGSVALSQHDEIIEKESAPTKEDKKQIIEDALVKEIPEEI